MGTVTQGHPRRNGFALHETAAPNHAQKQVRFAFPRFAETGTSAFLPLALRRFAEIRTRFCGGTRRNGYANRCAGRVASSFRRNGYGPPAQFSRLPAAEHFPPSTCTRRVFRASCASRVPAWRLAGALSVIQFAWTVSRPRGLRAPESC